jgi:hypothetical protein
VTHNLALGAVARSVLVFGTEPLHHGGLWHIWDKAPAESRFQPMPYDPLRRVPIQQINDMSLLEKHLANAHAATRDATRSFTRTRSRPLAGVGIVAAATWRPESRSA